MKIFVINLDRHPMRWRRMEGLLQGLAFKRIAAVDGRNLDGPEYRNPAEAMSRENLSRYNRACLLSHRAVWQEFLAGGDPYCCVLEDDVFFSPDFARFINSEAWIPTDCNLLKIETVHQQVFISRKTTAGLGRQVSLLRSAHLGTAAYIVSRRGAQASLDATLDPERAVDRILFEEAGLKQLHPVYQLFPALCIQANQRADGMIFPEMESSIQPKNPPKARPPTVPGCKTLLKKIKRELFRPFYQFKEFARSTGVRGLHLLKGARRCRVPFA
jgi:glycosyl transferase, family 25